MGLSIFLNRTWVLSRIAARRDLCEWRGGSAWQVSSGGKQHMRPSQGEHDYLVEYPGFQNAYGVPLTLPRPEMAVVHLPGTFLLRYQTATLEIAGHINRGIEALQSTFAPHVVLVFYPDRWQGFRSYRTDTERFDVHDFVKAFCVQRGVATQFLEEDTLQSAYPCRVWWWRSYRWRYT